MKKLLIIVAALMVALPLSAQKKKDATPAVPEGYKFTDQKINPATSVKNQASSGTCWSYSGLAFLESELMRKNKGEHDLSEMFVVRYAYLNRAIKYVRMHGNSNFAQGGAGHDNFDVIDQYGIVPQEIYQGLNYGTDKNAHSEMEAVLKGCVDAIIKNPNRTITPVWQDGFNAILDTYLGKVPEKFTYRGKEYTPKSFASEMGIKKSDYISITSFIDKPMHSWFAVEVPDNTSWGLSYNVTLDEMMKVIDNAIEKGETILWSSDVSEKGFQYNKGIAVLPAQKLEDIQDSEKAKWSALTPEERAAAASKLDNIVPEINVTPELRQLWYDNYQTTDDHGMQIVGSAKDQNGNKYYKVKNSWADGGIYKGYFYASEEFVKGKTMSIMVAVDAIPFVVGAN